MSAPLIPPPPLKVKIQDLPEAERKELTTIIRAFSRDKAMNLPSFKDFGLEKTEEVIRGLLDAGVLRLWAISRKKVGMSIWDYKEGVYYPI